MKQVAKSEGQILYAESGLPDRDFATAEVFGVRKSGGKGTAYTRLEVWEYVALKGKAYSMSGIGGEAIIRFGYTDQGPRLTGVEWAADGDLHDKWVKRNFPRACQVKRDIFDSAFINGQGRLWRKLTKEVEKGMGVPVEEKNLLRIDEKKGTYQIVKEVRERKPLGRSRFVTIDKGRLSDVKRKR